jgi:isopenicillin N synthase-like dioxygenase
VKSQPLNGPNGNTSLCRKEMVAWDKRATEVVETLMELLSQGLGLEAGKLKEL